MSRGAGRVMRAVEERLTSKAQPVDTLAADIFDTGTPTRAQVESVRRAAKRLAALDRAWAPRGLVRTPWTESERAEAYERRHQFAQALRALRRG